MNEKKEETEMFKKILYPEDVGLIALCTHGRSAVKEVLLGSVAGRVIRRSRQAVLVIRSAKMCPPASTAAAH
jgi:nucleotide-binding universal stress UspA family protein